MTQKFIFKIKKTAYIFHRWIGVVSLIFILNFAITGILLNHATDLGLYEKNYSGPLVRLLYQTEISTFRSFEFGESYLDVLSDKVFLNNNELNLNLTEPVGFINLYEQELYVFASNEIIFILDYKFNLIERLPVSFFGIDRIDAIGILDDAILVSDQTVYDLDGQLLMDVNLDEIRFATDSTEARQDIYSAQAGASISRFNFISDLHSGRILAKFGVLIQDLFAVFLIILSVLGGYLFFLRYARKP
jgi:hypothetical protein